MFLGQKESGDRDGDFPDTEPLFQFFPSGMVVCLLVSIFFHTVTKICKCVCVCVYIYIYIFFFFFSSFFLVGFSACLFGHLF